MRTAERPGSPKALAGLVGFLARGAATHGGIARLEPADRVALIRKDGQRRSVEMRLVSQCLARGLITGAEDSTSGETVYALTGAGRAALRRWLADPDSAFQDQHRQKAVRTDADFGSVTLNELESPLAALARLKGRDGVPFLGADLVAAGERLRADFTRGQLTPALGQRWEPVRAGRQTGGAGGIAELTDAALAARQRLEAAIAAVGPELSGVMLDACCFLKLLSQIERERQWPARSSKLMLRTALAALARHYAAPKRSSPRPRPAPPPHVP
jgi:hypothetical protein